MTCLCVIRERKNVACPCLLPQQMLFLKQIRRDFLLSVTQIRMGAKKQKSRPTSFYTVTSTSKGISPPNFLTFSFDPFDGVKFQAYT